MSQWGHDFRPEYLQLSLLHERFPRRAAHRAHRDRRRADARARSSTRLDARGRAAVRQLSFDRPNIRYTIVDKNERARAARCASSATSIAGEAGIVYCLSRRKVDETAAWLAAQGVAALPYHAGLDAADARASTRRASCSEDGIVIVATIAFGMGIDKPDVRFVAHLDLPKSIEGYYQETGRAGPRRRCRPTRGWRTASATSCSSGA